MKSKIYALSLLTCLSLLSCDQDMGEESMEKATSPKTLSKEDLSSKQTYESGNFPGVIIQDFKISKAIDTEAPCEGTELNQKFNKEFGAIIQDPNNGSNLVGGRYPLFYYLMSDINYVHSLYTESKQYYGRSGKYTNYVNNRVRSLEKFFPLKDDIQVKGQHRSTLNDRESILFGLQNGQGWAIPDWIYEYPLEMWADMIIANNVISKTLPESPLVAADGFAWTLGGGLSGIVIGDGLIELVSSVGTDQKIGWTTVLSHEWAHQVQYDNNYIDYWRSQFDNAPEGTRAIELEADFTSSYYMTHKRGATYNMKRIEQYLENFFQIGDCGFTSSGHHGTPDQRMKASDLGNKLAKSAQKKGKILSAEEIHTEFIKVLDDIAPQP